MITDEMINQLKKKLDMQEKMKELTVPDLIQDIIENHHVKENWIMDQLLDDIKRFEKEYKSIQDERLNSIFGNFREMSRQLKKHFEKEEHELFPILKLGVQNPALSALINEIELEHGRTENFISEISKISDYFQYQKEKEEIASIYCDMQALFSDISEHENKEEGVLLAKFQ